MFLITLYTVQLWQIWQSGWIRASSPDPEILVHLGSKPPTDQTSVMWHDVTRCDTMWQTWHQTWSGPSNPFGTTQSGAEPCHDATWWRGTSQNAGNPLHRMEWRGKGWTHLWLRSFRTVSELHSAALARRKGVSRWIKLWIDLFQAC